MTSKGTHTHVAPLSAASAFGAPLAAPPSPQQNSSQNKKTKVSGGHHAVLPHAAPLRRGVPATSPDRRNGGCAWEGRAFEGSLGWSPGESFVAEVE